MDPVYTTLYMGGNEYPVISFEESGLGITHESINGFIKVILKKDYSFFCGF